MGKTYTALYRIPTLLLISLFAVCTLLTASYGLNIYHLIQQKAEDNFIDRTGLSYIATKLRQSEAVTIELPDPQTLILIEEIDGQNYATSISFQEGMLRESFGRYGQGTTSFATAITAARSFSVTFIAENLVEIALGNKTGSLTKMVVHVSQKEAKM